MPASKATTLGPGILKFGRTGENDFSCQVTQIRVTHNVNRDALIHTLCGGQLTSDAIFDWTLEATMLQDLEENGIVHWSWENKNENVPFEFVPTKKGRMKITGTTTVDPIDIGGEVKKRNTSDIKWTIVGEPKMAFNNTVESN